MRRLYKQKNFTVLKQFNYTYRYIDDITIINGNGALDKYMKDIYHKSLTLVKVNTNTNIADVLDITIEFDKCKCTTSTFDKRRNFNFTIVNFPHINSNVPQNMCYNVYKEQVRRHLLLNSSLNGFCKNIIELNNAVSTRGYDEFRLLQCFEDVCKNYNIAVKYNVHPTVLVNKNF